MSSKDGITEVLLAETTSFLTSLHEIVDELTPDEVDDGPDVEDDDPEFLREKLLAIADACDAYDPMTIEELLNELKDKIWSKQTTEVLKKINELFFISDFEGIADTINKFLI